MQEANGHIETARYIGFGVGPVLGGLLFAVGDLKLAMLVDAATFAAVGIAALALRVRRHPEELAESERSPRARSDWFTASVSPERCARCSSRERISAGPAAVERSHASCTTSSASEALPSIL